MGSATTPRLAGELLGTAMLVFFAVGALLTSGGQAFVLAVALLLAVTAAYWVFGGHFNPYITLATAIRGTTSWGSAIPIIIAQLLGGIAGAGLMWAVYGQQGLDDRLGVTRIAEQSTSSGLTGQIIAEALAVFLLCCVVFAVGDGERLGIAMGVVYALGTLAIYVITAASMNLARSLGTDVILSVAQLIDGQDLDWASLGRIWIYAVSGVLGAALAALLYPLWRPDPAPAQETAKE